MKRKYRLIANLKCLLHTGSYITSFLDLVDTVYNESVHYFADTNLDLRSGSHFNVTESAGFTSTVNGPINKAIQLTNLVLQFQLVEPYCFDRPSICREGLSMAFWVKYPGQTIRSDFFFRQDGPKYITRRDFQVYEGVGLRAVISNEHKGSIQAYVSSQTHKCFYRYVYF